jgi:hypothetical protein
MVGRKHADSDDDESCTVLGFRAAYVFDLEQTDGEPLPAPAEASGDPGVTFGVLDAAIRNQGVAIEFADDLGGALGTSHGGTIRLLRGLPPATTFTTLLHEYAHLCTENGYVRCLPVTGRPRRRRL